MLHLLHFHDLGLLQHFDRIKSLVVVRLHEMHSAKASSAKSSLYGEVGQGIFTFGRSDCRLRSDFCRFVID